MKVSRATAGALRAFLVTAAFIIAVIAAGVGAAWIMRELEFNDSAQALVALLVGVALLAAAVVAVHVGAEIEMKESQRGKKRKKPKDGGG